MQSNYFFFKFIARLLVATSAACFGVSLVEVLFIATPTEWVPFATTGCIILAFGGAMLIAFSPTGYPKHLSTRFVYSTSVISWFIMVGVTAVPFYLSSISLTFAESLFEATAALTTTGASTIAPLKNIPFSILLWRAILQWIGGVGIILAAVSVLPNLQIASGFLLKSEFSDRSEKLFPKFSQIAASILLWYTCMTVLCFTLYLMNDVTLKDSLLISLTTVSTGGMSPYDTSFAALSNWGAEIVCVVFTILGSLTMTLQIKLWQGHISPLFRDEQTRGFFIILTTAFCLVTLILYQQGIDIFQSLRVALFSTTASLTTSGFANTDTSQLPSTIQSILMFCAFIGGTTGSTAGGLKIFRIIVLLKACKMHLKKLLIPHGVFNPTYNRRPLESDTLKLVLNYIIIYILTYLVFTISLIIIGLRPAVAFNASLATLTGFGPGFVSPISSFGGYESLSSAAQLVLALEMLVGRLELLTFYVFIYSLFRRRI